ncbi:MAG: EAL domain-containing protein [Pirellulaceae bacterium]
MHNASDPTHLSAAEPNVDGLLRHIDELVSQFDSTTDGGHAQADVVRVLSETDEALRQMKLAISERDRQLQSLSEQSTAMARAQADAIVHSAEIIDELERTKQHLHDARTAAEEAAGDTQRLADTIFERTHDGVMVLSNRMCIACNDNLLELLDCERSEVLGGWPAAFDFATDAEGQSLSQRIHALYDRVALEGVQALEMILPRHQSDEPFWAELTMSAFDMKESAHVLMVVRDITARKRFEVELRRHRDFLDNIINAVPDQLFVTSKDDELVVANDAFCTAHGVHRDQVVGQFVQSVVPSGLAQRMAEIEKEILGTGECRPIEHECRDYSGKRNIVSIKRSIFQDSSTGDRYVVATSRDITEDRRRETRLRLLASVFKGASEGVAILSAGGVIREANPAFVSMFSEREATPIGKTLTDAARFDLDGFDSILNKVAGGAPWSGKAMVRTDGVERTYWISLSPSSDRDDKVDERATRVIALVSDITELERTQEKLRHQALFDNLTNLPNRRFFREYLQRIVDESDGNTRVTICFLDLDDFKHVNDSTGHSAGDQLLQAVGRRIQQAVGCNAFIARFGGDEFAVIMPHEDAQADSVQQVLDHLLTTFREPFKLDDSEAIVGISIGVTRFPDHGHDVDALMCNADIAMYSAKASGKNRVCVFTPDLQDSVTFRHQVQTNLRRAMVDNEIWLLFQPKIHATDGRPIGCEALVRWKTRDGKNIPPSDFIPVAEQTGLILPLGELVFLLAAQQACHWHAKGVLPNVAVNVSPHQLRHPRFTEQLLAILERTGAKAEWFELEITEHAMMDDVTHATTVIERLASLGFRIAIDDFGTGYSSLSYLKTFRIHTLKIDLSFIRDLTNDPHSEAIVRSIVSLGTGLGLSVVAEGVETAAQADVLRDVGCDVLQGYLIGRPMTAEDYVNWLTETQGAC